MFFDDDDDDELLSSFFEEQEEGIHTLAIPRPCLPGVFFFVVKFSNHSIIDKERKGG